MTRLLSKCTYSKMSNKYLLALFSATTLAAAQGGLFIVHCKPLTVQRTDPIISPGQLSSHVHAVVGGTGYHMSMSNDEARDAQNTTCDKALDKSNYWQPQLYHQHHDDSFELIKLLGIVSCKLQIFANSRLILLQRLPTTLTGPVITRPVAETATAIAEPSLLPRACA